MKNIATVPSHDYFCSVYCLSFSKMRLIMFHALEIELRTPPPQKPEDLSNGDFTGWIL